MKNKISDRQNMKKPPQKVAYFFFNCPTAQMAEFMFPNVAFRAFVYRTGLGLIGLLSKLTDL